MTATLLTIPTLIQSTMSDQENSTTDITADSQVAKIFAWRRGFNAVHLIDLGVELGLFRAFADAPDSTPQQIAEQLELHPPYVDVWCTTAYGFELLEAAGEERRFRLAPFMTEILATPSHPRYLGGYVRLGTAFAAEDFRRCVAAFRSGETKPFQGRNDAFARTVAESTWGLQVLTARKLLPGLPGLSERLAAGGTILEIGCGTGQHLLQLAQVFPHSRCIGVDIDPVSLALARETILQVGLTERIEIIEGDIDSAISTASCDAVVMVEVLHEITPTLRQTVINSCARALQPGGWLVIVDETYPATLAEARQPEFRFPLQTGFEELIWGNVLPTREEQEQLLTTAGFSGAIQRSLIGEGFTLLTTQR